MPEMGAGCDALPGGQPSSSPKRPLSKSLRRSASNRAIPVRGAEVFPSSLAHQKFLKASLEQNPELHLRTQQLSTSSTLFPLKTTTPSTSLPPPLLTAKSKHLSRSLTSLPLEPEPDKTAHSKTITIPTHSDLLPNARMPCLESCVKPNVVTSREKDMIIPVPSQQDTLAGGPDIFVKSLFRSSTFSALRKHATPPLPEESSLYTVADPPSASKSFWRSFTFKHMPSKGGESVQEQNADPIVSGLSKWARSIVTKPAADQVIEVDESSPYSLHSGSSAKWTSSVGVLPIAEVENSFDVFTKGLLDSSRSAVKAVQNKARHLVSQKWYQSQRSLQSSHRFMCMQHRTSHLDMVYIAKNIIAVEFPVIESNILGFMEADYRDYIEELVTFCEMQHLGKYKIFNLCSEELYDTSLLYDKVACFPFQTNNCPPLQLVSAFCEAVHTWLKAGLENVVVVHCKGGMARTGLMISCLLLHLNFFSTAEESVHHYNEKRCVNSNALILPSHLRYVKYYEEVLRKHHGFTPGGRRCTLRSIRLINCPSWIRPSVTISDHDGVLFTSIKHSNFMLAEDLWISALNSKVLLFELPNGGHAAAVDGDFRIHFQNGEVQFSCWLNTNMMRRSIVLRINDLDGNEGLSEATGFQVELEFQDSFISVMKTTSTAETAPASIRPPLPSDMTFGRKFPCTNTATNGEAIFTDSEGEDEESPGVLPRSSAEKRDIRESEGTSLMSEDPESSFQSKGIARLTSSDPPSDFHAMAAANSADASLFTFGDEEDYQSDEI
ncbi:phosphatidylinositol 3,4,5-trisphosphate 3-phosphatase and protein-tyrosine-phosphatase PTEN2A isoform X5 [Physcomitrium patens]|uniref:protein-tyrosine-phosphatase n=1 Tax=Physcomitrium patens TaxID=3218 RepID=A0A7I4CHQ2_PHYPA|nr:phosphatidylinositol 3,4,5-trisphosphate 3-phosphatase and protein-tyrosine-phosphatase PTEN2A-like isoform X5 [Physcomitrium patens]|eukprot:XP_024359682.1 phosphatidylinositol 3,4,5-trisphosphate 3-phosphatase and protein-tyrosine-phosphatase PTEN2A-like isoform X5 [Physcomitrella patens]